ncbi:MAG: SurA N-terminal domain-containing protein, partial [Burkholderiaceae bacterium]
MFEFIRTHQRLMQLLLLLLILPSFAFFGLQSYSRFQEGDNTIVKVGDQKITKQEWDAAQREQMERFRRMFGQQFDPKMVDTPQARQGILDNLVAQHVMSAEAARLKLAVPDSVLQQAILQIPGLTGADGKFDVVRYKEVLGAQGLTPAIYQEQLRHDLALQQLNGAIQSTAFAPKTVAKTLSDLNAQQRSVRAMVFKSADYAAQVKVTDEAMKNYYSRHGAEFTVPEQVDAQFLVLDLDAVAGKMAVNDADIKSYYEQNIKRYTVDEQRRASHILIAVDKNASDADKAKAKARAEALLAQVRANPSSFAEIAKKNSQDPGSAPEGGDLGFFGKNAMVKPFEDAVYKLKEGEISDVVQSDFGYHIIRLTGIKPAAVKPLADVKDEIAADIRKQMAAKKFS